MIADSRFCGTKIRERIPMVMVICYFDIGFPVDVVCYTPEELISGIKNLNFFIIDAIEYGIPLPRDSPLFSKAKKVLGEMKKRLKLKPTEHGWRFETRHMND